MIQAPNIYGGGTLRPVAPPVSTAPGGAPAPHPAPSPSPTPSPSPSPSPSPAPMSGVNPALTTPPAPPPSFIPVSPGLSNPTTQQSAPTVGSPSGYPIDQGIDTSVGGLLPDGFSLQDLSGGHLPDAATPATSSYIQQAMAQQQAMTPWTVTPEQTVQGQFAQLMAKGNPAIQAVEEQTLRAHAASGGRNNLMAQSAANLTGAQVALTIAAQDAATYAAAGQFNAAQANDFAKQMNQFIDNAMLSRQNFDQGVAMLKDQANQQIEQLYAQVQANAATQSTNLKSTIATLQAQTNATLEQMDKTFSQNVATLNLQHQFASDEALQNYGQQVRLGYLASVNTNQNTLMQTIGEIRANPNITTSQASAAVQDAIDQFNAMMTMNNSYYAAMVPGADSGAQDGTYNSAAYDYSVA